MQYTVCGVKYYLRIISPSAGPSRCVLSSRARDGILNANQERKQMQYRRLGNGPLTVSELSFGTWLTVAGGIGREQATRCIHTAVDHGITLFDTANQYGAGEAERVLGEALRSYPRDKYMIATKLYFPVGDEPDKGLSAAQIEKQLDRSLERLGVEWIDLDRKSTRLNSSH